MTRKNYDGRNDDGTAEPGSPAAFHDVIQNLINHSGINQTERDEMSAMLSPKEDPEPAPKADKEKPPVA